MPETCNKHDDCLGRIHTEINEMNKKNSELTGNVNSFMDNLTKFMNKVDQDVYDPKDGLGSRVNSHATQLGLQWGVITTIIGSIIVGIVVGVMVSWLKK